MRYFAVKPAWLASALILLGGCFQGIRGQNNDYPFPNAPPCPNNVPESMCPLDTHDPYGFFYRECTSFIAWRMNRDAGITNPQQKQWFTNGMLNGTWGDAGNWDFNANNLG